MAIEREYKKAAPFSVFSKPGNVTSMLDSSGLSVYNYDVRGLLLSETKGDIVKTYTYDANGNRTSFVAPSININTTYTYDSLSRLLTVSDTEAGTTTYTYDEMGNVLTVKNSGGTVKMAYDAMNRLRYKKNSRSTYNISYYKDSNVKTVTENNVDITYTYTDTGALASGDGATYKYDKYGNRSEMIKDDMVSRYSYDKNNRLIASFSQADAQTTHYTYDANGNMLQTLSYADNAQPYSTTQESIVISETAPTAPTYNYYTFDVLGRMSSATVNGTTTTYTYDGNGLRQTKNNKAFVYDGANIVWEGESLTTGTTYYRGLELIARSSSQGFARYQTDWHGNVEGYDYDDFGNPTGGNTLNPFRYNGEYFDEETGFIYLRARYYDPGVGRFVSEDPHWNLDNMIYGDEEYAEGEIRQPDISAILQNSARYVYGLNNPVVYKDSSGEFILAGMTLTASQVVILGGAMTVVGLIASPKFWEDLYHGVNSLGKSIWDAIVYAKGKAKDPTPPSKLKDGDKVKTPDSHPDEFDKNKDGSYTHKKTGWTAKKDPSQHGGPHWDMSPKSGKGHINVGPNGNVF